MKSEVIEVKNEMISTALQKFNLADAAILKMADEYLPLKTNGLKDAKAYTAVHEARMVVKGKRVEVEKKGKELRAEAIAFQKAVIAEEKRLIGLLSPIEEHLQAEEDKVENEKSRIKKEAEEKEAARIQARINVLFDYGCKFNGIHYYMDSLSLPVSRVKDAPDEEFQEFCLKLQALIDAENDRKAEEEKKRKEEAERLAKIAAEQEVERQRLAAIAKEQTEKEAKIKAEQEAERKKLAAEQEAIERQKREIQAQKDREEADKKRKAELEAIAKAAAEKARIEEAERIKREAAEKAEQELLEKMKAERQEALKPDKEKLLAYADAIETVKFPEVSKDLQAIIAEAKASLTKVANIVRKRTRDL
jgi:DNA repair exonuclease SbcCD ATPase subunit